MPVEEVGCRRRRATCWKEAAPNHQAVHRTQQGGEGRWARKEGTIPSGDDPGPGEALPRRARAERRQSSSPVAADGRRRARRARGHRLGNGQGTDGGEARWAGNDGISPTGEETPGRKRHCEACSYPDGGRSRACPGWGEQQGGRAVNGEGGDRRSQWRWDTDARGRRAVGRGALLAGPRTGLSRGGGRP